MLFRKLADENADIDPDDDHRAPVRGQGVDRARGVCAQRACKDIGVAPNPRRAANYLHHAAIFFGDKEAQFELAKLYLSGEGGERRRAARPALPVGAQRAELSCRAGVAGRAVVEGTLREDRRAPRPGAHHHGGGERAGARPHLDRRDLSQHLLRDDAGHAPGSRLASWRGGARCSRGPSPSPSIAQASAAGSCSRSGNAPTARRLPSAGRHDAGAWRRRHAAAAGRGHAGQRAAVGLPRRRRRPADHRLDEIARSLSELGPSIEARMQLIGDRRSRLSRRPARPTPARDRRASPSRA